MQGWCDLQSKYAAIEDEPAYDNSEVANTSLLVSAANSLNGWTGLAELWIARRPKDHPVENEAEEELGRGLLDAYLATDEIGFLLELKQGWMVPDSSNGVGFKFASGDPIAEARTQIQQLNYSGSYAKDDGYKTLYGAFLVPTYDRTKTPIKRGQAFDWLSDYCEKNFEIYAVFSPRLTNNEMTREHRKAYRPAVALALKIDDY